MHRRVTLVPFDLTTSHCAGQRGPCHEPDIAEAVQTRGGDGVLLSGERGELILADPHGRSPRPPTRRGTASLPPRVPARRPTSRVFLPTETGLETAVTGQTGPNRFRYRPVSNRPKFKIQI